MEIIIDGNSKLEGKYNLFRNKLQTIEQLDMKETYITEIGKFRKRIFYINELEN